jgi:DNA-binding beta-propeller fold protein YncE
VRHLSSLSITVLALATAASGRVAGAQAPGLSGTIIVTNKGPATATLVDAASGTVLATLPTGNGPHEIVVSRDGRTAVVTDYGTGPAPGSTLTVIDVPGLRVGRTIPLGEYRRPHGIVFLPGDSLVAVTSEANRAVLIVNVHAATLVKAVMTDKPGSHMVGVASDGVRAWTGDMGSHTVTELDLATGRALRAIAVPQAPEAINVTPDGSEAWVGSNATGRVSVVDARTGLVSTAAEGFGWPYRVLFTPDGSLVMMPDYRKEELRFVERVSRRELGRMAFAGGGPQGITLTADGRTALLSLSAQAKVVAIDVASRRVTGEYAVGETPDGVVISRVVVRR